MRAVDIGIGHDDDAMVAGLLGVEVLADVGADGRNERADGIGGCLLYTSISDLRHRNVHRRLQIQRVRNCCSIVARLIANLHRVDRGGVGRGSQENVVVLFFVASHLFFDIQTDMNIDTVGNRRHKTRVFLFIS